MLPNFIGVGLILIVSGSGLSLIGHYDGILGADDPETFITQDLTHEAKARLVVLDTPAQAQERFLLAQRELILPAAMAAPMAEGQWVSVQVDGTEADAFLRVSDVPEPGTLLVFEGTIQAHWPVQDSGIAFLPSTPILLLEPIDYHVPLIFKA